MRFASSVRPGASGARPLPSRASPLAAEQARSEQASPRWVARGTGAYKRISGAFFLAGFSTFSLLYCVQPLLPVFSEQFRVDPAASSLALSLATGFLALALLGAAILAEGLGRRSLMFLSMAAASVLNIATAVAPNWPVLLGLRALEGFALGGVPAVAMAYLSEEIDPRGLGLSMGLYIGGSAFGGMVGRVATGILAEQFSWRVALTVIGIAGLATAIGFILLVPPSRNFTRQSGLDVGYHLAAWRSHLRHAALPLLFLVGFLAMGSFVTIYNYAGYRLTAPPFNLNQTELGLIFTVYIFGIVASSTAGVLADRIGHRFVLPIGFLVTACGVALTLVQSLTTMIFGITLLTIGFFITHTVASSWIGRLALKAKGHASSLYLLVYYIGSSVVGSLGGWFLSVGGWPATALFTLALLTIGFALSLRLHRLTRAF